MARIFFLHIYLMRVPLAILLILGLLFPAVLGSSMLHGLADLTTNQIWSVSFGAFLLFSAAVTCCFLVLLYGSERADGQRAPAPEENQAFALPTRLPRAGWCLGLVYLGGLFLYLRFLWRVQQVMAAGHLVQTGLAATFWMQAAIGFALGIACVVLVFFLDLVISSPRSRPQVEVFAFPLLYLLRDQQWLKPKLQMLSAERPLRSVRLERLLDRDKFLDRWLVGLLGPGYGSFNQQGVPVEMYPGHQFAAFFSLVCLGFYLLAGWGMYHRLANDDPFPINPAWYDAVLLHVILLLLIACWVLSAFSFFFDRFRTPVLIPLALILLATSRLGPSDHGFYTYPKTAQTTLDSPQTLLSRKQGPIIVVAAAGGGIQAAAWTSQVLCELRGDPNLQFADKVLAVSGVSGGSVGTMFYLRCLESPVPTDMTGAKAARESSLEAVAWGLAHPDLRRAVLPVNILLWPGADRGWALERALRKNAQFSPMDRPLANRDLQKQWPVVLLNSTEARTGDPMVFTNSDFPETLPADRNHSLHGFHVEYPGRDTYLESAARMSAAFPYVSPSARPTLAPNEPAPPPGQPDVLAKGEHLVDGGYFDNSGLFTLTNWLKAAIPDLPAGGAVPLTVAPRQKILILSISAFADSQWHGPDDKARRWPYQIIAPISAILNVRSEGQVVHDLVDSANLIQILQLRGYDAAALTARYDPAAHGQSGAHGLDCDHPPLTWRLNEVEKFCIDQEWEYLKLDLVAKINAFFSTSSSGPQKGPAQVTTETVKPGLYLQKIVPKASQ
jgi:Patatin-like phospholipase